MQQRVDNCFLCVKMAKPMNTDALVLLKYAATTESVSVQHYPDGSKCYAIPVLTMLFDDEYESMSPDDIFDTSMIYLDISYKMMLGFPYMQCKIVLEKDENFAELENISIPLNPQQQNPYQRKIISLINTCSKRVIEQEMKKNKIARAAVAYSATHNNLYN